MNTLSIIITEIANIELVYFCIAGVSIWFANLIVANIGSIESKIFWLLLGVYLTVDVLFNASSIIVNPQTYFGLTFIYKTFSSVKEHTVALFQRVSKPHIHYVKEPSQHNLPNKTFGLTEEEKLEAMKKESKKREIKNQINSDINKLNNF
jgi:hypothetical protein